VPRFEVAGTVEPTVPGVVPVGVVVVCGFGVQPDNIMAIIAPKIKTEYLFIVLF